MNSKDALAKTNEAIKSQYIYKYKQEQKAL
jgi:hypothetical protein